MRVVLAILTTCWCTTANPVCAELNTSDSSLSDLARQRFGEGDELLLSPKDRHFFDCMASGEVFDLSAGNVDQDDPKNGRKWGRDRELAADRLTWLCFHRPAAALISSKGVQLKGVRIPDLLVLTSANLEFPLVLDQCSVPGGLLLTNARLPLLDLRKSEVFAVTATGAHIFGDARMDEMRTSRVEARNATIDGSLILDNATVEQLEAISVDLRGAQIGRDVTMQSVGQRIPGPTFHAAGLVTFMGARIGGEFSCTGTWLRAVKGAQPGVARLDLEACAIDGTVKLDGGFRAEGEVRLRAAKIGRSLYCDGARLESPEGWALNAEDVQVGGNVTMRPVNRDLPFTATGVIDFNSAVIRGSVTCEGGSFRNPDGDTIRFDLAEVGKSLLLGDAAFTNQEMPAFTSAGRVSIAGARVGRLFRVLGGEFADGTLALNAESMVSDGNVQIQGARVLGAISFTGASIAGNLSCSECQIVNTEHPPVHTLSTLNFAHAKIDGALHMSKNLILTRSLGIAFLGSRMTVGGDFWVGGENEIDGHVDLQEARVGGNVTLSGKWFVPDECTLLRATGLIADRRVIFDGFQAFGDVNLLAVSIAGELACRNGCVFEAAWQHALALDSLAIEGTVFLSGRFIGQVKATGAVIGGDFDCKDIELSNEGGDALSADGIVIHQSAMFTDMNVVGSVRLRGASVGNHLNWRNVRFADGSRLDLSSTSVVVLQDDPTCWPTVEGGLLLDGFTYQQFGEGAPVDAPQRLSWLRRQPSDRFFSQPYEQLAAVLRSAGREQDAVAVLIAKEEDPTRVRQMTWNDWLWWRWVAGTFIGYGYRPWRAFWIGLVLIAAGAVITTASKRDDLFVRSKEGDYLPDDGEIPGYPALNPLMYSVDAFAPLISLNQCSYWLPAASRGPTLPKAFRPVQFFVEFAVAAPRGLRLLCLRALRRRSTSSWASWRVSWRRFLSRTLRWVEVGPAAAVSSWVSELHTGNVLRFYLWGHTILGWTLTTLLVVGLTGIVKP